MNGIEGMVVSVAGAASTLQCGRSDGGDKEVIRVVVGGSKRDLVYQNPWNACPVRDLERAAAHLRKGHSDPAAKEYYGAPHNDAKARGD